MRKSPKITVKEKAFETGINLIYLVWKTSDHTSRTEYFYLTFAFTSNIQVPVIVL